jgi:diguanylate cyclase (GGDEF)-like protein
MKTGFLQTLFKNEEDLKLARILSILILASFAVYIIVVLINLYVGDIKTVVTVLVGIVILFVSWWLLMRGYLRISSLLVALSELAAVTVIATVGQGIRDIAILGFPIIFVFASLTLDRTYFRLCVGLALAAIAWLAFGETSGWFVTRPFPDPSNWLYFISTAVLLLVAAVVIDLLATNMRKNLEQARYEIAQRRRTEQEKNKLLWEVSERIKELDCLYSLTKLIEIPNISLEELFHKVVNILPAAWQYPEIACARVVFENHEYATNNYQDAPWKMVSDLRMNAEKTGMVEICYLEQKTAIVENLFLAEEQELIDAVAERLSRVTERKRAEIIREIVYEISKTAISTENIEDLYHSIHKSLGRLIPVGNFYIALYDRPNDLISFPYYVDQFDAPPLPARPGHGLTEYIMRIGKPLHAPRVILDQLFQEGEVEAVGAIPVDWLGVPLEGEGQVIGAMVTQSYQENIHFRQEDLRLLEFVSTQVAQMIDRKRVEEKVRYMSIHDSLTGLYNRAYFDEELKRLEHGRQFPVSILMADLDKMKEVNDMDGHAAGDELLRQAAGAIRAAFRQEDVVARIGGDEFAVLLPGIGSNLAGKARQRILDNLYELNVTRAGKPIHISMGCGTADDGYSLVEALKIADNRMYIEKQDKS